MARDRTLRDECAIEVIASSPFVMITTYRPSWPTIRTSSESLGDSFLTRQIGWRFKFRLPKFFARHGGQANRPRGL